MRCAIGVIGSLSVKVPHAKTRGYVAGKKIIGRKRHIAVDTDGRLLMVTADIPDSAGAHLARHNPRRHGRKPYQKKHPSMIFKTDSKALNILQK